MGKIKVRKLKEKTIYGYISLGVSEEIVKRYYNKKERVFKPIEVFTKEGVICVVGHNQAQEFKQINPNVSKLLDYGTLKKIERLDLSKEGMMKKIQEQMNYRLWYVLSYLTLKYGDTRKDLVDDIYKGITSRDRQVIAITPKGMVVTRRDSIQNRRAFYLTKIESMFKGVTHEQNKEEKKKAINENLEKMKKLIEKTK